MIKSNGFVFCISRQAPFSVLRYMRPIRFRKVQDEFDEQYRWRVACVKTGQHTKPTRTAKLASCLTRDSCYYRRVCECETGPFLTLKQKLAPISNTEPWIGAATLDILREKYLPIDALVDFWCEHTADISMLEASRPAAEPR
jgi:hypothetical protein